MSQMPLLLVRQLLLWRWIICSLILGSLGDLDSFRECVTEVEQRFSSGADCQKDHNADLHTLKIQVCYLEFRAEDVGNRNWWNNLRILGLSEGAEGSNPTTFTENLLTQLLPNAKFLPFFTVERVHRIPTARGPPGVPLCAFIFYLLQFKDRDLVLCASMLLVPKVTSFMAAPGCSSFPIIQLKLNTTLVIWCPQS